MGTAWFRARATKDPKRGCLGYLGVEMLPSYMGIIMSLYKEFSFKFLGKERTFLEKVLGPRGLASGGLYERLWLQDLLREPHPCHLAMVFLIFSRMGLQLLVDFLKFPISFA